MELTARTHAGADLLALAEWLAAGSATPDGLLETGYVAAPVPVALGGLGVESIHDLVVASSRLARGDAALAAAATVPLVAAAATLRHWPVALLGELFAASVCLGIAEAAFARVPVAASAADLATARAVLSHAARRLDRRGASHPALIVGGFGEARAAKRVVSAAAARVVGRASAGYSASSS
jgi:hypothetical protein